jgi:alpha-galactosidase/6-phospho-beta-glucosidase family protein
VPKALDMARDVEDLAPHAWVVNFVNPATVLGIALMRYAPNVRSFAICDGLHEPYCRLKVLKAAGIIGEDAAAVHPAIEQKLDLRVMGVNHFTFMTRLAYDGRDYLPAWRERIVRLAQREKQDAEANETVDGNARSKRRFNETYALDLFDLFGAYPDRVGHTKEYLPYYQGYGVAAVQPEPIKVFDWKTRQASMDKYWAETEAYATGRKPLREFLDTGNGDHATDIIESMWGGLGKPFYVNTANRGAVANMAGDAYLELRSDLDMTGPRPHPVGDMPRGLLGLQQQVLDTHELTAEAAVTRDRKILLRALAVDPLVNNLGDARAIMEEALEREKDILGPGW